MKTRNRQCIHHPDKPHYARGLCRYCFNFAYKQVRIGSWSWEGLEKQGKCLPKGASASGPDWAKDIA